MLYKHETLVREATGAFGKLYALVHVPECDEIAGSGARHVMECYRVVYMFDGNRHSKEFKTQEEAENEINTWTKLIVVKAHCGCDCIA
jgi:hypothetical protein